MDEVFEAVVIDFKALDWEFAFERVWLELPDFVVVDIEFLELFHVFEAVDFVDLVFGGFEDFEFAQFAEMEAIKIFEQVVAQIDDFEVLI